MSDHHHDHDHENAHDRPLSGPALRVKALESLLVEKGLIEPRGETIFYICHGLGYFAKRCVCDVWLKSAFGWGARVQARS